MAELWALSAIDVASGMAARAFSSEEVTTSLLGRIEHCDGQRRAFITVDTEQALAADGADRAGPLHHVPIAIKRQHRHARSAHLRRRARAGEQDV